MAFAAGISHHSSDRGEYVATATATETLVLETRAAQDPLTDRARSGIGLMIMMLDAMDLVPMNYRSVLERVNDSRRLRDFPSRGEIVQFHSLYYS